MEMKHWKDEDGNWWKEVISPNYNRLVELKDEYKKRGARTWINPYNSEKYMLTVMEERMVKI